MTTQDGIGLRAAQQHAHHKMRAASGNRTTDETTQPIPCGWATLATIVFAITGFTRTDVNETLAIYAQTSYDNGATWVDLECYSTTTAGAQSRVFLLGIPNAIGAVVTPSDGALAANTRVDLPLGTHIRLKIDFTNPGGAADTYAYNADLFLRS